MPNTKPYKAGDRVGIMRNGYSLVPGIVLAAVQSAEGRWYGDVLTEEALLEGASLHPDFVMKEKDLMDVTQARWGESWKRLEERAQTT